MLTDQSQTVGKVGYDRELEPLNGSKQYSEYQV
jgi:hypothetical protein